MKYYHCIKKQNNVHNDKALCGSLQELESQELLERFRLAHTALEERDQKLQQAEGFTSSIRLELLSSDTERRHLRQTISHQETEIQQVSASTGLIDSLTHKPLLYRDPTILP